jgi:SAM-dependent methyltransferase
MDILKRIYYRFMSIPGSTRYWEERYSKGGNSGAGSYGRLAIFKAQVINNFVFGNKIQTVLELGCGDGNQLKLANYPSYVGFDVSATAVQICKDLFEEDTTKEFILYTNDVNLPMVDLTLSLDVIYHLIEDSVYEKYMRDLFGVAKDFVIIYSSNQNGSQIHHERMRDFEEWVRKNAGHFEMIERIVNPFPYDPLDPENTSQSDFFIFKRNTK